MEPNIINFTSPVNSAQMKIQFVGMKIQNTDSGIKFVPYWDARKVQQLNRALHNPSFKTLTVPQPGYHAIPSLIELLRKLPVLQKTSYGSNNMQRSIRFDLTQVLSPQGKGDFEKGCQEQGILHASSQGMIYTFNYAAKSPTNHASAKLPSAVLGKVFSFLEKEEVVQSLTFASSFQDDDYLQEAFKGKEDELVKKWIKKNFTEDKTIHELELPTTLHAIRNNVRKLDLSSLKVTPFLLKSLAVFFSNVEEINLAHTTLQEEHLQALSNFPHLKTLSLCQAKVNGNAFKHLSSLTSLERLDLALTDITSECFSFLPASLKELDCFRCYEMGDAAIIGLKDKIHLEVLNLSDTKLNGEHFSALPPSLKVLRCNECESLTDEAILGLKDKIHLEILDLFLCSKITGKYFNVLSQSLKKLDCRQCYDLTDEAILGLKDKIHLEILKLSMSKVTGEHFNFLSASLKKVDLDYCAITDAAILGLKNKIHLEILHLRNTKITGVHFSALPASLRELDCRGCYNLSDLSLEGLQNKIHLETLNLAGTKIIGFDFGFLPTSLKTLDCRYCSNLSDFSLKGLQNKIHLEVLDLSETNLRGGYFGALPLSLKSLNCWGCPHLTDVAIIGLEDKIHLEALDISGTNITGEHFSFLPSSLKELGCMDCFTLTDVAIIHLRDKIHLKTLNLSFTNIVGEYFNFLPVSLIKVLDCDGCVNLTNTAKELVERIKLTQFQNLGSSTL